MQQELGVFYFILAIIVVLLGVLVVGAVIFFGKLLIQEKAVKLSEESIKEMLSEIQQHSRTNRREALQALADAYLTSWARRNEFWAVFGQVIIAIAIITVLTVMLLASVISAEAGLPILSAISGFALAKSTGFITGKTTYTPEQLSRDDKDDEKNLST